MYCIHSFRMVVCVLGDSGVIKQRVVKHEG